MTKKLVVEVAMEQARDLEKGRYRENKERFERPMDMMKMELPKFLEKWNSLPTNAYYEIEHYDLNSLNILIL